MDAGFFIDLARSGCLKRFVLLYEAPGGRPFAGIGCYAAPHEQ